MFVPYSTNIVRLRKSSWRLPRNKLTSSQNNNTKGALFKDFCTKEDNEGTVAHLEELHYVTIPFLAKHVVDHDVWTG